MPRFVPQPHRAIVEVTGPDRVAFLQGLVSQDIAKVGSERAMFSALLTAQGKFLHDFFVIAWQDSLWLETEGARAADLMKRLRMYKLRSDVGLAERPDLAVAAVLPDNAGVEAVGLPVNAERGHATTIFDGVAFIDPRVAALGARVVAPADALSERLTTAGLHPAPAPAYEALRLSLAVPDGARDLVVEKSTLMESNYDELAAIDWKKGCYMGQELTARTKYRGLVKRRLFGLRMLGDGVPVPGAEILGATGKPVGEVRSVHGGDGQAVAIAALKIDAADGPLTVDGAPAEAYRPDWLDAAAT